MSKFSEGTKVIIIGDDEAKRGVVRTAYDYNETAIVDMEDGTTEKVCYGDMAIAEDPESVIKSKIPIDEQEITITYGEFKNKAVSFIKELGLVQEHGLILAKIFGGFAAILFEVEPEND